MRSIRVRDVGPYVAEKKEFYTRDYNLCGEWGTRTDGTELYLIKSFSRLVLVYDKASDTWFRRAVSLAWYHDFRRHLVICTPQDVEVNDLSDGDLAKLLECGVLGLLDETLVIPEYSRGWL